MTPTEAAQLLGVHERISCVASSGWTILREELVRVRLELSTLIRQAKKSHHPDHGGKEKNFHNIDIAARYFVETNLADLVSAFLPSPTSENLTFCTKCGGSTLFRGSRCPECGGRGTVIT